VIERASECERERLVREVSAASVKDEQSVAYVMRLLITRRPCLLMTHDSS
jgi:hypothetical protein